MTGAFVVSMLLATSLPHARAEYGAAGTAPSAAVLLAFDRRPVAHAAEVAAVSGIAFDAGSWPLVVMTCAEDMEGSVGPIREYFEAVHARKEPFAILVDTRPVKTMPGPA